MKIIVVSILCCLVCLTANAQLNSGGSDFLGSVAIVRVQMSYYNGSFCEYRKMKPNEDINDAATW